MFANSREPDQTLHLQRLIVCRCPTKRTLGLYGLNKHFVVKKNYSSKISIVSLATISYALGGHVF